MIYPGNKKGQVAILMLFVVALVLVIATLFVLFSSKAASSSDYGFTNTLSYGKGNLDSVMNLAEKIVKESITSKVSFYDIAIKKYKILRDLGAVQVAPYGNFFVQVENKDAFSFVDLGEIQKIHLYNLKVSGLSIEASSGNSYEKRNFDLCMLFDKDGNYLEELSNEALYIKYCPE